MASESKLSMDSEQHYSWIAYGIHGKGTYGTHLPYEVSSKLGGEFEINSPDP